ncbi:hypothetical protein ACMFMF_006800 [Clarireedia jacksonii]
MPKLSGHLRDILHTPLPLTAILRTRHHHQPYHYSRTTAVHSTLEHTVPITKNHHRKFPLSVNKDMNEYSRPHDLPFLTPPSPPRKTTRKPVNHRILSFSAYLLPYTTTVILNNTISNHTTPKHATPHPRRTKTKKSHRPTAHPPAKQQ